jgi:hypothetical protein
LFVARVIAEHVAQRVADLARGRERASVVAAVDEPSAAPEHLVELLRETGVEASHAALEAVGLVPLHHQMEVIAEDGVLDHAHAEAAARLSHEQDDRRPGVGPAQAGDAVDDAHRHEYRMGALARWPWAVLRSRHRSGQRWPEWPAHGPASGPDPGRLAAASVVAKIA